MVRPAAEARADPLPHVAAQVQHEVADTYRLGVWPVPDFLDCQYTQTLSNPGQGFLEQPSLALRD